MKKLPKSQKRTQRSITLKPAEWRALEKQARELGRRLGTRVTVSSLIQMELRDRGVI